MNSEKKIIPILSLAACLGAIYDSILEILSHDYLSSGLSGLVWASYRTHITHWSILLLLISLLLNLPYLGGLLKFAKDKQDKIINANTLVILLWLIIALLGLSADTIINIQLFTSAPFLVFVILGGLCKLITTAPKLTQVSLLASKLGCWLILISFCGSCYSAVNYHITAPSGPNLLFIVADCLRKDFDQSSAPNLTKLAKAGISFENAYAVAPWTKPSVASYLTGLPPFKHSALSYGARLPLEYNTIAEVLRNAGYWTIFINARNFFLNPFFDIDQGFIESVFLKTQDSELVVDKFSTFLRQKRDRPFFAYLHLMDLHVPFENDPRFRQVLKKHSSKLNITNGADLSRGINMALSDGSIKAGDKKVLKEIYQLQLEHLDQSLGRVLKLLSKHKLVKNTVVVFTSDHGEEFWDHQRYEHGHTVYNELLHIPLVFKGPVPKNISLTKLVGLNQLPMTFSQLAGIAFPNQSQCSIFNKSCKIEKLFPHGTLYGDEKYSLIRPPWKLIYNTHDLTFHTERPGYIERPSYELYNLVEDPSEEINLADSQPGILRTMQLEMENLITASPRKGKEAILDKNLQKQLESLGYVN